MQTFCDLETIYTNEGVHSQNGFPVVPRNWKVFESQMVKSVRLKKAKSIKTNSLAVVEWQNYVLPRIL